MKSSVKNLRKALNKLFEAGHVDRSKRKAHGYDESNADVDYTDINEDLNEIDPGTFDGDPNQGPSDPLASTGVNHVKDFLNMFNAEKDPKVKDRMKKTAMALGVDPKHFGTEEGVTQSKRKAVGYSLEEPADYDIAESDVPMALRVKLYQKQPADDPMMGPPHKMVDLMGGDDASFGDMDVEVDEADGDEEDFGGVQSDVDKAPGTFSGLKKAMDNGNDAMHHGIYNPLKKKVMRKEASVPSLKKILKKK